MVMRQRERKGLWKQNDRKKMFVLKCHTHANNWKLPNNGDPLGFAIFSEYSESFLKNYELQFGSLSKDGEAADTGYG